MLFQMAGYVSFLRLSNISLCIYIYHIAFIYSSVAAAAAAKSHQSCPTLWDPTDGSPPGSPIPGILQARVLEWGATAFICRDTGYFCILAIVSNAPTTMRMQIALQDHDFISSEHIPRSEISGWPQWQASFYLVEEPPYEIPIAAAPISNPANII